MITERYTYLDTPPSNSDLSSSAKTSVGNRIQPQKGLGQPSGTPSPVSRASLNVATKHFLNGTSMSSQVNKALQSYNWEKKFTFYSERTDILQGDSLFGLSETESLATLMRESGFFWIDVTRPSALDMGSIAETFSVHPLTIEDVQVRDNREKCEIFEKYIFICIRTCDQRFTAAGAGAQQLAVVYEPINVYMIVFQDHLLTIHAEPVPHIRHVLRRVYPLKTLFALTSDWVMYGLLDDVVDEFMPNIRTMEMEVDSIDDLVLVLSQSDQSDMLRRIGRARKRVTHLLRLLHPKAEVIKALTKRCPERLKTHTLLYMRDIQDHVITMVQNLDHYSETLNRSHSNYLAQISIELNQASNRMSVVMKKLTAAASLMLPLSLISGIWGMNVPVPGGDNFGNNFVPFLALFVFMMAVMTIMFLIGRRQDWF